MRRIFSTALLCLGLSAGAALAQDGGPVMGQAYGDWVFQCAAVAQDKTVCAFSQTVTEGQRKVAQFQIREATKADGAALMTLLLPLGFDFENGVNVTIDDGDPLPVTLKTCRAQGCVATMPIDQAAADQLRSGEKMTVALTANEGQRKLTIVGSLKGLTDAFAAAGWF